MLPQLTVTAFIFTMLVIVASLNPIAAIPIRNFRQMAKRSPPKCSSDPMVQVGCDLSNSSNPDPKPKDLHLISTGKPTPITDDLRDRINTFSPYAAAVYCPSFQSGNVKGCGRPCDDLAGVEAVYQTGDDNATPHAVITYSPENKTLVIAHDGTNFTNGLSILNDLNFTLVKPPSSIMTVLEGYSSSTADQILVHGGILGAWSRSYDGILTAVQNAIKTYPDLERVTSVGHSLGGSISIHDTVALRGAIDKKIAIEGLSFAPLRVGNPSFARLVDQLVADPSQNMRLSHVINSNDIIPHLGPLVIGYQHSDNEIFLPVNGSETALLCPGNENINCALGRSLQTSINYHSGPYLGRHLGGGSSGDCKS